MLNLWVRVCQFAVYLYLVSRAQVGWSRLYRWLYERQYRNVPIQTYDTLEQLARVISRQKWTMDSWREFFHAVSTPQKVQALINANARGAYIGDCDEFAIYLVAAVRRSMARLRMPGVLSAQMMTVSWNEGWVPQAHNVCLLQMLDGFMVRYAYMDYGKPSRMYYSIEDVAQAVAEAYDKAAIPLVYAISNEDLSLESINFIR